MVIIWMDVGRSKFTCVSEEMLGKYEYICGELILKDSKFKVDI